MLFQGEEWGASTPFLYFTDHDEPELAEAVREGRRREFAAFGWDPDDIPDPQSPATFDASRLRWEERERPPHDRLLDWYRRLIRLRRDHPDLIGSDPDATRVRYDEARRWVVVERGEVTVAVNLAEHAQAVPRPPQAKSVLDSYPGEPIVVGADVLQLPPGSVAVLAPDSGPRGPAVP
jgi:maltooligosyltrehalose trehalohydrolase